MDVTELDLTGVPGELHAYASRHEWATESATDVLAVPGAIGWALHAGVRQADHPLRTYVCASSYDRLILDLEPVRVQALYGTHPQLDTAIALAGMPGAISEAAALARLEDWGANVAPDPRSPDAIYFCAPVFLLTTVPDSERPVAIAACSLEITADDETHISVDVTLRAVATHPDHRGQGLAHLILLEASRWLGMLTRSMQLSTARDHALVQRIHALPLSPEGYHLAQAFRANFAYFGVTRELVENTAREFADGLAAPGSVRAGLGTIRSFAGVEDMVLVPEGEFVAA